VLAISFITRYNMSVLELEVVIYLVLAAVGMYSLLKSFSLARIICIVGGISYMSCGYITGSASVIPWISSAAFIPFVFRYLKKFLENVTLKNAMAFSISLCLLFLCGYPTFFIYTSYIVLVILVAAAIAQYRDKPSPVNRKTISYLLLAVLVFLCICSPAIVSYWEFLPYYSRGSGITVARAAQNPFTPFSSLSFVLPNAVSKDHPWLDTDTSMRNSYVGLFVFLLFILSFFSKYTRWQRWILGITVFSFILSLGPTTPLHKICYSVLPLFNTFRHPANIRLFTSIGIILLAAFYTQQLLMLGKDVVKKKAFRGLTITGAGLGLVIVYSLFKGGILQNIRDAFRFIKEPKTFLDAFSFDSFLLIQSLAQVFFIIVLVYLLKKKTLHKKIITVLFILNSVLFCWIALPFNFISQLRTSAVNQYVRSFPDGYPMPDIHASVESDVISDSTNIPVYGYANFYAKTITIQDHVITPTLNSDYETFYSDRKLCVAMAGYPAAWLNDTLLDKTPDSVIQGKRFSIWSDQQVKPVIQSQNGAGTIRLTDFSPNSFSFTISAASPTVMSLFQQYHHNWKVNVNGRAVPLLKMNIAFMGVQVPAGESTVAFHYKPGKVITAMWVSLAGILILVGWTIFSALKARHT